MADGLVLPGLHTQHLEDSLTHWAPKTELLPVGRKQIDLVLAAAVEAPADNSQNSYRVAPVVSMADRELLVLQHVGFPQLQELMEVLDLAGEVSRTQLHASFQLLRKVLLILSHDLEQFAVATRSKDALDVCSAWYLVAFTDSFSGVLS